MDKFLKMLYKSKLGTAIKYGVAAGLMWVLQNQDSLNIHPLVAAVLAGSLPVVINMLNPQDPRGGMVADEVSE